MFYLLKYGHIFQWYTRIIKLRRTVIKKKQDDFILWFEFAFIAEINKMLLFKMKLFSFQYFVFLPG